MRLIDSDIILEELCGNCFTGKNCESCENAWAVGMIYDTPTIADVVPVSEIMKLRNELVEEDLLTMRGLMRMNQFIYRYGGRFDGMD